MSTFQLGRQDQAGVGLNERVSQGRRSAYAIGGISAGISMMVPSVLLLYFCTEVLKLPLAMGSLIILAPKAAIIALDPLIGRFSDRLRTPIGRRAPLMLAGALLSPLMFAALFSVSPGPDRTLTFVLELLAYLFASVSYSLFGVPFIALPAEMPMSPQDRAGLLALRVALFFLGMVLGAAAAPLLAARYGGGGPGYRDMALTLAPFLAVIMLASAFSAVSRSSSGGAAAAPGPKGRMADIIKFAPFHAPLLINFAAMTGMSAFMAASPYFITFGLGAPAARTSLMVATQLIAACLSMAFWGRRLARQGVRASLMPSLCIAALGAATTSVFGHLGLFIGVLAGAGLFGAGVGGAQAAGQAALSEAIRISEAETSASRGGQMTGLWTASERIAYALGPALASLTLSLGGFVSGAGVKVQAPAALEAARLSVAVGPCVFLALGLFLTGLHPVMRRLWRPGG